MVDNHQLPASWIAVRVNQAGAVRVGRQRSPDKQGGRYATKYIRAANITRDGIDLTDLLEMDFTPAERMIYTLNIGDVVLTEASGSPQHVGRAALWRGEVEECCFQNTVLRFRPHLVLPRYALVAFRHYATSGVFARTARGVGIQHLGATRFAALEMLLPPIEEQRRIADATDHRLSEIREAEARLRSARRNLDNQIREILAAAVAGELTNRPVRSDDKAVPRGEPDLETPMRTGNQKRVIESLKPAELQLTKGDQMVTPLPRGWHWVRVDDAGDAMLGRQRSPRHQDGPHLRPYLRVANVLEDRIETSDILKMNFEPDEFQKYALRAGDILLNEGQSPELVGRPAIYREEIPGVCFQNTLIRFRGGKKVVPEYALLVFRHFMHAGVFRRIARWSTNIAHLGLNRFRALPFPLPPLSEQERIVGEAEERLRITAEQITVVDTSLQRLPEMESQLFAAAATGELIPQDPADEPASALLERLGPPPPDAPAPSRALKRKGEIELHKKNRLPRRRTTPTPDLAQALREEGGPLDLPKLFAQAGYDRDQPEHVERFFLELRSHLGRTIRDTGARRENAILEVIDAATQRDN